MRRKFITKAFEGTELERWELLERNAAKDSLVCSSIKMMLPPTEREHLSDKPGLRCCHSTQISWHTNTHQHPKPKTKPTQKEVLREKLNMLYFVNGNKGYEVCVGDKYFHRKCCISTEKHTFLF